MPTVWNVTCAWLILPLMLASCVSKSDRGSSRSSNATLNRNATSEAVAADAGSCQTLNQKCNAQLRCCNPLVCLGTCQFGVSDRDAKSEVRPVFGPSILGSVERLHISYEPHAGARVGRLRISDDEFEQLFRFGQAGRWIYPGDADGVTLASIQELHRRTVRLAREQLELTDRLRALQSRVGTRIQRCQGATHAECNGLRFESEREAQ
jgi:hypothetical protein